MLSGTALAGSAVLVSCSNNAPAATPASSSPLSEGPALLNLFNSPGFNDQALFALGAASSRTAEVGEILQIARTINNSTGNPASPEASAFDVYVDEFGKYADKLENLANTSHPVTARDRYLRSSMYAAQQLYFVLGTSAGNREEQLYDTMARRFSAAIDRFVPKVERFSVNSDWGPLPGYFFRPDTSSTAKPTVIISEGIDGQNVETMQFGVTAGLARGYNVVLFEGPGQMSLLFKHQIPFTPAWDQVVKPVLAWTRKRSDVGPVALKGISFGGMLCSRPAARLKGLDAVVLEPGAYSFAKMWGDQRNFDLVNQTQNLPPAEKQKAVDELNQGFLATWPQLPRSDQFTIYKRGETMSRQVQDEARAGQPVSNFYGLLEQASKFEYAQDFREITIPTMITMNEGDEFFSAQSVEAFAMLEKVPESRKTLLRLTTAEGASLHDQPVGPQVAEEYVYDWLDDQLRR